MDPFGEAVTVIQKISHAAFARVYFLAEITIFDSFDPMQASEVGAHVPCKLSGSALRRTSDAFAEVDTIAAITAKIALTRIVLFPQPEQPRAQARKRMISFEK